MNNPVSALMSLISLYFSGYISNLCNEPKESAVAQLLSSLPLLKPGNTEAKEQYLKLIPKILSHSIKHGIHIEESRQLLSYSLIHPAINSDERSNFTLWLGYLEEHFSYNNIYQSGRAQGDASSEFNSQYSAASTDTYNNKAHQGALTGLHMNGWQQHVGSRDPAAMVINTSAQDAGVVGGSIGMSNKMNSIHLHNNQGLSSSCIMGNGEDHHAPLQATQSSPANFHSTQGMLNNPDFNETVCH